MQKKITQKELVEEFSIWECLPLIQDVKQNTVIMHVDYKCYITLWVENWFYDQLRHEVHSISVISVKKKSLYIYRGSLP